MGTADDKLVSATMFKNIMINTLLIALWYSFSISISVYNKWMFSKENLDFHFPLFVTSIHMIVQFLLASRIFGRPAELAERRRRHLSRKSILFGALKLDRNFFQ